MAKADGRVNNGGARPGAGRKTIKTEREIKERLQKLLPKAYKAIETSLDPKSLLTSRVRTTSAYKLLDKFIGDKKALEIDIDGKVDTGVIVLPCLNKDTPKAITHSSDNDTV